MRYSTQFELHVDVRGDDDQKLQAIRSILAKAEQEIKGLSDVDVDVCERVNDAPSEDDYIVAFNRYFCCTKMGDEYTETVLATINATFDALDTASDDDSDLDEAIERVLKANDVVVVDGYYAAEAWDCMLDNAREAAFTRRAGIRTNTGMLKYDKDYYGV